VAHEGEGEGVLGGIFRIDREELKEIGEKCVMRSCMMCSAGDEMGWDGVWHVLWRRETRTGGFRR